MKVKKITLRRKNISIDGETHRKMRMHSAKTGKTIAQIVRESFSAAQH